MTACAVAGAASAVLVGSRTRMLPTSVAAARWLSCSPGSRGALRPLSRAGISTSSETTKDSQPVQPTAATNSSATLVVSVRVNR